MVDRDEYARYGVDGELLAEVGRIFIAQSPRTTVRLPLAIAQRVVAAWERDEDKSVVAEETPEMWAMRDQAATLALLGLSLSEHVDGADDEVVSDVPAWFVGLACEHADRVDRPDHA